MSWDKMDSHGGGKTGLWRAIKAERLRKQSRKKKSRKAAVTEKVILKGTKRFYNALQ